MSKVEQGRPDPTNPALGAESQRTGSLALALAHAERLLETRPDFARDQAIEILQAVPAHPQALLILGTAHRLLDEAEKSCAVLLPLAKAMRQTPDVHFQFGLALADSGDTHHAIAALRHCLDLKPDFGEAWRALGDLYSQLGDDAAADDAYARQIKASVSNPLLLRAADALCDGKLAVAELILRDFIKAHPKDAPAYRMLAEVGTRLGHYADAEALLEQCLEMAPGFHPARYHLAVVQYRQGKAANALTTLDPLVARSPNDPNYLNLKAAALGQVGGYDEAIAIYDRMLARYPNQPKAWMSYGHALKTAGRQADGVAAYRRAISQSPGLGEAYWSLANLKTVRFNADDHAAMAAQLARDDLGADDRLHFHFALGKAHEDDGAPEAAFEHYAAGNKLRRTQLTYSADEMTDQLQRSKALLTEAFFKDRADAGDGAQDPVFVVGLPRSGSTLIEQILSSHAEIEGTMELPDITAMARALGTRQRKTDRSPYPDILATLSRDQLGALGADYLARTRIQRKTSRPFFIDKMPHNFLHTGLIHLILPNAKIIDARRHPMATCWSVFKQHFARGQAFAYDLVDIARYYRDYVDLMDHIDRVLPGRVLRVTHEELVADTEAQTRRLLDYCGVAFDPQCLKFYENDRPVRTASSEQVRRPISRDGLDQWQTFAKWLEPARAILEPFIQSYPALPDRSAFAEEQQRPNFAQDLVA